MAVAKNIEAQFRSPHSRDHSMLGLGSILGLHVYGNSDRAGLEEPGLEITLATGALRPVAKSVLFAA